MGRRKQVAKLRILKVFDDLRGFVMSCINVDHPVTPIRVCEKKNIDNTNETSDSCVEFSANWERRITRSCSKALASKVEVGEILENKKNASRISKRKGYESNSKKPDSSVQLSVVRLSCNKKEKRSGACKGVKIGAKRISSDTRSRCVTRGGRQGSRNTRKDDDKGCKTGDSCREMVRNVDRRITPSASKQAGSEDGLKCQTIERRSTHLALKGGASKAGKAARSTGVKGKKTRDCVESDIEKFEKESSDALPLVHTQGKGERKELDFCADTKLTGVKRKRKQVGVQGKDQGWTREQELALHKAYFTEKPSPDFWKKVAKQVPGKSAQECFDKVHLENQTPLYTKPSSRARKLKSPISGFELSDTAKTKNKKTCKTKCKSHVGRKIVRQLLQKYCHVNQDSEADLFSVLEPSVNPSAEACNLTPKHLMRSPESSSKSLDRSSSGHKKCLSRFSDKIESPLTSPPVLKKVKNMSLHDKNIDQLHTREHKRKVAFSRCMKSAQNQKAGLENSAHLKDIIKAAKEALVSDAKEVINKYRYSQANIMEALSDSEEFLCSDNEEDESVL